jgi:hypothetical protein
MDASFIITAVGFKKGGCGDEAYDTTQVVGELVNVENGNVEIVFDEPTKGGVRHYLTFKFGELADLAARFGREEPK